MTLAPLMQLVLIAEGMQEKCELAYSFVQAQSGMVSRPATGTILGEEEWTGNDRTANSQ